MIDEKILVERLEEHKTKAYVTGFTNNAYEFGACHAMNDAVKIVNQLAEEHNKKYEPTMDLIEHGVEGYNHHLQEQYRNGYADGWHDCSCTIQQSAPYQPKGV